MEHLRRHPRFDTDAPALIRSLGPSAEQVCGRIADISESGFQLVLPRSMAIDEPIEIDIEGDIYIGEIRNMTSQAGDWLAGVELVHWIPKDTLAELKNVWGCDSFRSGVQAGPVSHLSPWLRVTSIAARLRIGF